MALPTGEPHRKYPSDGITPGCGDALLFDRLSIGLAGPNYQHSNKLVGLLHFDRHKKKPSYATSSVLTSSLKWMPLS
ncbi:hypothetical protein, partial [Chlorobaculum sp. 24CR]|uniref:hypothetical protein n=1 Tax=Chlorobaculum sp. 24CR TaxID=2508878 RepID=UPI001ADA87B4